VKQFEHFPAESSCFLCGKKTDSPCVLIGVDGTGDGRIEQAEPIYSLVERIKEQIRRELTPAFEKAWEERPSNAEYWNWEGDRI